MVNRELRLREDREIRRTRAKGRAFADGPIVARILPAPADPPRNRYSVVAGKRVGKSHERNRCKRLVREAIRLAEPDVLPGHDVVIVIRGGIAELTGLDVAQASWLRILKRANLLRPEV